MPPVADELIELTRSRWHPEDVGSMSILSQDIARMAAHLAALGIDEYHGFLSNVSDVEQLRVLGALSSRPPLGSPAGARYRSPKEPHRPLRPPRPDDVDAVPGFFRG